MDRAIGILLGAGIAVTLGLLGFGWKEISGNTRWPVRALGYAALVFLGAALALAVVGRCTGLGGG